ncbi:MAG: site-2 protease family protein [Verrucomicrobia bacterium]|nr:site-2 protease family protein [Verrucomicrobiota bacterium]
MDLGLSPDAIRNGLLLYLVLFASLVLRTFAQAWLADRFGDPTPRDEGRVTLYPVPHIDLLGSVVLPLICIFYLQPQLGQINFFLAWMNPVPMNPSNFGHPRRDFLLTQFAGFGMSVILALVAAILGGLLLSTSRETVEIFIPLIGINAMLMMLDFLPVPPLPGGALLRHWGVIGEEAYWSIARWSGLVLIIAFNLRPVQLVLGMIVGLFQAPFILIYKLVAGAVGF